MLFSIGSDSPVGKPEEVTPRQFSLASEDLQRMALDMNPTLQGMKKMIEAKQRANDLAKGTIIPTLIFGLPTAREITAQRE